MDLKTYLTEHEMAASFARRLGVSAAFVSQWRTGVRPIPAARCPDIERATNGAVTCKELRPDVDWAYLRNTKKQRQPAAA